MTSISGLQEQLKLPCAVSPKNRARGALLGLAVGDAVGTTVEFQARGSFPPMTDMVGGGVFHLLPGQWTDDASMALCIAQSLKECEQWDAEDVMGKFRLWYRKGYMSSNGRCFDIGNTTRSALEAFESDPSQPYAGSTDPNSAGNGSIMRLAPVPVFCYPDIDLTAEMSADSSRTTHGAAECVEASQFLGIFLHALMDGKPLGVAFDFTKNFQTYHSKGMQRITGRQWMYASEDDISSSGYVIDTLEAALWCCYTTHSFDQAVLKAANLGRDADTVGAVTGQIAGALYGYEGIPYKWRELVYKHAVGFDWIATADLLFLDQ